MTPKGQAIFEAARALPLDARVDLVDALLRSVENGAEEVDVAWAQEARARFDAFLQGRIQAEPMNEVMPLLLRRHVQ